MKFTALEEYGLRCILRLAVHEVQARGEAAPGQAVLPQEGSAYEGVSLTIGEIAAEEGLTQEYAGKIFRVLARAGLVESERGRKGGYRLARPPEKITVGETLDALGGRMFDDDEVCGRFTGDRHTCVHSTDCAIRSLWRELQVMIDRVVYRTTLSDLVTSEHVMSLRVKSFAGETPAAPAAQQGQLVTIEMLTRGITEKPPSDNIP